MKSELSYECYEYLAKMYEVPHINSPFINKRALVGKHNKHHNSFIGSKNIEHL